MSVRVATHALAITPPAAAPTTIPATPAPAHASDASAAVLGTAIPVSWADTVPIAAPPSLPPSPPGARSPPAGGVYSPLVTPDMIRFVPDDPDWVEYQTALHARWVEVGHFHDDDGPFYGVDDEDAFAMDEDWDFSEWGDPEPDRGLTSLNMTLQSVIWQLETDETGTEQLGITPKRRAQMTRFVYLLRQHIRSLRDQPTVATGD